MEENEYRKFINSCAEYLKEQAIKREQDKKQKSLKRNARDAERKSAVTQGDIESEETDQ